MTTAGNRTRELVEQVLQSQWRKIGVDIRIKNEPARVLFGETVPHRRFDLAMYAWISAPENVPRSTLHSSEIPSEANGFAGQNTPGFKQRRDGPADRRARDRARPGEAQGDVGRVAAPLRDRAAVAAALFPLRRVHPAEMAQRRATDRATSTRRRCGSPTGRRGNSAAGTRPICRAGPGWPASLCGPTR